MWWNYCTMQGNLLRLKSNLLLVTSRFRSLKTEKYLISSCSCIWSAPLVHSLSFSPPRGRVVCYSMHCMYFLCWGKCFVSCLPSILCSILFNEQLFLVTNESFYFPNFLRACQSQAYQIILPHSGWICASSYRKIYYLLKVM